MIEFISHHPISTPLTTTPHTQIPLQVLHIAFERIKIENGILETKIIGDRIVHVLKKTFLKSIGIIETPKGLQVREPTSEDFQTCLNEIGYNEEFKLKKFKKSAILELWTILMHLILRGLSGKHGGTDTKSKDCMYVVYNIYSGRNNVVDLTKVLWQDF